MVLRIYYEFAYMRGNIKYYIRDDGHIVENAIIVILLSSAYVHNVYIIQHGHNIIHARVFNVISIIYTIYNSIIF